LPYARSGGYAIGIEQFKNAPLPGLITDLRDSLDLVRSRRERGTVFLCDPAPLDDCCTPSLDLGPDRLPEDIGFGARLLTSRLRRRSLRTGAIEQWDRDVDAEDASYVSASDVRALRSRDNLGFGNRATASRLLRKPCRVELASQRDKLTS
jgi:hypothetical protein